MQEITTRGRVVLTAAILLAATKSANIGAESFATFDSEVFQTDGTATEIFSRAKICIARNVSFDGVVFTDAAGTSIGPVPGAGPANRSSANSGNVFVAEDAGTATIVANSRTSFRFMLVGQVAQSVLTLFAKDGRFMIQHTGIKFAQSNTGYLANDGFQPMNAKSSAVKPLVASLTALNKKIADCISSPAPEF